MASLPILQGSQPSLQGGNFQLQPTANPQQQGFIGPILQPTATAQHLQPTVSAPQLQPAATAPQLQPAIGGTPTAPQSPNPLANAPFGFMDGSIYNQQGSQLQAPTTPSYSSSYRPSQPQPYNPPPQPQYGTEVVKGSIERANPLSPISSQTDLEKQVQDLMNLSPEEIQAQNELNNLIASTRSGYTNIDNKTIPLEFITGQKRALEQRSTDLAIPLQQRLALEQAKRQAALDASKFALSRFDAKSKPIELSDGGTLINPTTGEVIYQNPKSGQYSLGFDPLTGQPYVLNARTGELSGSSGSTGTNLGTGGSFPAGAQTPGSAAAVNNPLGIKPNGQFSQYATPDQGFQAGVALVQRYQTGGPAGMNANSTLNQMINTWITGNPNNTSKTGYNATNVAQYLQTLGVNVTPNTPIGQIDSTKLAAAIAHFETGYNAFGGSNDPVSYYGQQVQQNPQTYNSLTDAAKKLAQEYFRRNNIPFPDTVKPSDTQYQSATYATRVQQSGSIIDSVSSKIASMSPLTFEYYSHVPSYLQSDEFQSYDQAARNLINAVLRRESGAAISAGEFSNAYMQYLPRAGDSAQTLLQKKQNRDAILNGLIQGSGSAYNGGLGGSTSTNNDPLGLGI